MGELFAVVLTIITVVSTAIFVMHVWWLSADISVHGPWIDRQLLETMVSSGVLFVLSQLALAVFVWQSGDRRDGRKITVFPGGVVLMVVLAIVLVGAEILALTFVGSKVWIRRIDAIMRHPVDTRPTPGCGPAASVSNV